MKKFVKMLVSSALVAAMAFGMCACRNNYRGVDNHNCCNYNNYYNNSSNYNYQEGFDYYAAKEGYYRFS